MLEPNYIDNPRIMKTATEELEKLTIRMRRREKENDLTRRALSSFPLENLYKHTIHCTADYCFSLTALTLNGLLNIHRVMSACFAVQMFSGNSIRHFAPSFEKYNHHNAFVEDIAPVIMVTENGNTGNYFKWWTRIPCDTPTALNEDYLAEPGWLRVEVRVYIPRELSLFGPVIASEERDRRENVVSRRYDMQFQDSIYAVSRRTVKFTTTGRRDVPKMVTFWDDTTLTLPHILAR